MSTSNGVGFDSEGLKRSYDKPFKTKKVKVPPEPATIGLYGIKDPSARVMEKYGVDIAWWRERISAQKGLCPICNGTRERMVIDHEHAKGWKKMPAEKRRAYVRGIVCWFCNLYYLCRGMTVQRAVNTVEYMREFQVRFDLGKNPEIAANRGAYLTNHEADKATALTRVKAVSEANKIRVEAMNYPENGGQEGGLG